MSGFPTMVDFVQREEKLISEKYTPLMMENKNRKSRNSAQIPDNALVKKRLYKCPVMRTQSQHINFIP
jgi:hypothetical protein